MKNQKTECQRLVEFEAVIRCNYCAAGYNPTWDDEFSLNVRVPELAVVSFTVYTKDAFVAQYSLPFRSILQGL